MRMVVEMAMVRVMIVEMAIVMVMVLEMVIIYCDGIVMEVVFLLSDTKIRLVLIVWRVI